MDDETKAMLDRLDEETPEETALIAKVEALITERVALFGRTDTCSHRALAKLIVGEVRDATRAQASRGAS